MIETTIREIAEEAVNTWPKDTVNGNPLLK